MLKGIANAQAEQFVQPTAATRIAHTLAALVGERGSTSCTHAVPVPANATEPGLGHFSRSRWHGIPFLSAGAAFRLSREFQVYGMILSCQIFLFSRKY